MMFELESLSTAVALESTKDGRVVMADHVSLQAVHVGELLRAHSTLLQYNSTCHQKVDNEKFAGLTRMVIGKGTFCRNSVIILLTITFQRYKAYS